jgi:hypothetical protein
VNKILSHLLTLQTIELESPKKDSKEVLSLREKIPAEMLSRFDKFLGRGKKGIALVQNGVCKGCQIQVPVGTVNALLQGTGACVCGNCGRYLYMLEADALAFHDRNKPVAPVPKVKAPALNTKSIRPSTKKARAGASSPKAA